MLIYIGALALAWGIWRAVRPAPSVEGRYVVIVGASSGIGRSLALEYARQGATLLLCARRSDLLSQVSAECTRLSGHPTAAVTGDITERATQLSLRDAAAEFPHVDYLVLNAGAITVRPLTELWMTPDARSSADTVDEVLGRALAINTCAPILVAGLFLPLLAQSRGNVVVVASVASLVAAPTRSLYSAAKHAVEGYFSAFRMEVKHLGVDVTMVYPGTVDTDLRLAAIDAPMGEPVAGSKRGKMSPDSCARAILRAAALRDRQLVTPWPYWVAVVVHRLAPRVVEYLAMRKYRL